MKRAWVFLAAALLALAAWAPSPAGQHNGHGRQHRNRGHHGDRHLSRAYVPNPLHQKVCGECHFALPAVLLPQASWAGIMDNLGRHFGENLEISPADREAVRDFLLANASDGLGHKLGRKIMNSLGTAAPNRVSQVPYLQRKHRGRKVPPGAFQRKSVGSMANCKACHPGADWADFDDHRVRVPD